MLPACLGSAAAGDTILILSGIHEGNLTIVRRVALLGTGAAVIRGTGKGSTIVLQADSCVVSDLAVEHCGGMLTEEDAGILVKSHGNRITNCRLRDVLFGLYLFHAEGNVVSGNTITGRRQLELGERGSGIHIWDSHRNRFTGNTISETRDGFYIQNANHIRVENNIVHNVRYGLHYMYADSNVFLRNVFADNVAGAAVMYSHNLTVRHNVFSRNRGFASFGVLFQDCSDLVVDSNVIADNVVGLFFEATRNNLFRRNIIAQNDIALQMFQNSTGNVFVENNFIDNLTPLALVGKSTASKWSVGGSGNYWTGYDGYDMTGDGIGDIPMKIQNVFVYLEGRNANVRLFLYSPASQALAVASQTFPVIPISDEADGAPLMQPVPLGDMPAVRLLSAASPTEEPGALRGTVGWMMLPGLAGAGLLYMYRELARRRKE
jgi:nitrous oxidase accessory protein